MTEVPTIAVVRGLWQALSRRDWDAVKTFLADDCLYVDVLNNKPAVLQLITRHLKLGRRVTGVARPGKVDIYTAAQARC